MDNLFCFFCSLTPSSQQLWWPRALTISVTCLICSLSLPEGLLEAARLDVQVEGHELLLALVAVRTPAADLLVGEGALEQPREDLLLVLGVQVLVHLIVTTSCSWHLRIRKRPGICAAAKMKEIPVLK